jgi:DNA-binding LacI/PurR family transcriptional regulator
VNNRLRNKDGRPRQPQTILDIADDLHLSKTTISRAISGKGRIGAETRERVLSYIKDNEYKPNLIAKSLAVSKTFNIGVSLPTDAEMNEIPFFQTCLHSITETANTRGYDVVLTATTGQNIERLQYLVQNKKVDGIIITRLHSEDKAVAFLRGTGMPFVVIGTSADTTIAQVDSDHYLGCRELTARLLDSGCRHMALMAGDPDHKVNKDRYEGFAAACGGLATGAVLWKMTDAASIDRAMLGLMRERPECIVCMDDVICGMVLSWLHRKQLRVPTDIGVASFHDSAALAAHDPPITALRIDVPELGATAMRVLSDALDGKAIQPRTRLGYEIAIRDSSRLNI